MFLAASLSNTFLRMFRLFESRLNNRKQAAPSLLTDWVKSVFVNICIKETGRARGNLRSKTSLEKDVCHKETNINYCENYTTHTMCEEISFRGSAEWEGIVGPGDCEEGDILLVSPRGFCIYLAK